MRIGRTFLLALLSFLFVFPAPGLAEEAPLSAVAEKSLTPELEHADISLAGERAEASPAGRTRIVEVALRYLGTPYRWAGSSPTGFDCSGFVMYVYGRIGIRLPHNSTQLWGIGRPVARTNLMPGDILFFGGLSHVGIYVGKGRFVHSPHSGEVVRVQGLSGSRYARTYDGARRL